MKQLSGILLIMTIIGSHVLYAENEVTIIQPNGGETYSVGEAITIKWIIDSVKIKSNIVFYYSPDEGLSQFEILTDKNMVITNDTVYNGQTGTIQWTIPDSIITEYDSITTISSTSLLVAEAPYEDFVYQDPMDGNFTITAKAATSDSNNDSGPCGSSAMLAFVPVIGMGLAKNWRRKR